MLLYYLQRNKVLKLKTVKALPILVFSHLITIELTLNKKIPDYPADHFRLM